MRTVFKYPLASIEQTVALPSGARILCVQAQSGALCLWALVDTDNPTVDRTFRVYGTGHALPSDFGSRYIGTVQQMNGALVWHVFELSHPVQP
jgi:hypothetical protein